MIQDQITEKHLQLNELKGSQMMIDNDDQYKMIAGLSQGEYKEKGSKFLAFCYPVTNLDQVSENLLELQKLHPKSRHICYAYRLGIEGNNFRANDDGEPSGTAGRPILGVIDSFEVTNSLIAVVRYFGGTKLGASGLIQAYKLAARNAMEKADILNKIVSISYTIHFDYAHMGVIMDTVKGLDIEITKLETGLNPFLVVLLPKSKVHFYINSLKAGLLNRSLDDIEEDTEIDYLTIHPS